MTSSASSGKASCCSSLSDSAFCRVLYCGRVDLAGELDDDGCADADADAGDSKERKEERSGSESPRDATNALVSRFRRALLPAAHRFQVGWLLRWCLPDRNLPSVLALPELLVLAHAFGEAECVVCVPSRKFVAHSLSCR